MIRYLKHREIDMNRWDSAIENSSNRLVYAQSWYLDIVSPGWDALIDDEYISVMPLPSKQKYFIPYLIQPKFTQQLGIFSQNKTESALVSSFISAIPRKFLKYDISLNYANICQDKSDVKFQENYELALNHQYEHLWGNFNKNTQADIKKSTASGLRIEKNIPASEFINNYLINCKIKPDKTGENHFRKLIEQSVNLNLGYAYLVKDTNNWVLGGAFFINQFNRIIYLVSFTTDKGRNKLAMFYLINQVIHSNVNKNLILDFEGSTIPGIAHFFRGFGANCIKYPRVRKGFKVF